MTEDFGMDDLFNNIRLGVVSAVDNVKARVKVHFESLELTSDWLPVLQPSVVGASFYRLPAIGESVVCAFYSDSSEEGVALGSFYLLSTPPPVSGSGVYCVVFPDGSHATWDNGELSIEAKGGLNLVADSVVTGDFTMTGELKVTGDVTLTGGVLITGNVNVIGTVSAQQFIDTQP